MCVCVCVCACDYKEWIVEGENGITLVALHAPHNKVTCCMKHRMEANMVSGILYKCYVSIVII